MYMYVHIYNIRQVKFNFVIILESSIYDEGFCLCGPMSGGDLSKHQLLEME